MPDEGAAGAALVEDSDLDDVADQYILASRDETTGLVQTNVSGEKPLAEVAPAKNVQPAKVISQEDLDHIEKVNPLDAFDFLV